MVRFGVHDTKSPEAVAAAFPGVTLDRVFIPGVQLPGVDLHAKHHKLTAAHYAAGITPIVSVKLDPDRLIDGDYTTDLATYARYLADQPETWLIYWHEPENDMDGETFSVAFKAFRDTVKAAAVVPVGYSAMAYQWRRDMTSTAMPEEWHVDADFYAVDVYTHSNLTYREDEGFRRWWREVAANRPAGRPWAITERGFKGFVRGALATDSLRRRTIEREWRDIDVEADPPLGYVWWNTPGAEGDDSIPLGPKARGQLRRMIEYRTCPTCIGQGEVPRSPRMEGA